MALRYGRNIRYVCRFTIACKIYIVFTLWISFITKKIILQIHARLGLRTELTPDTSLPKKSYFFCTMGKLRCLFYIRGGLLGDEPANRWYRPMKKNFSTSVVLKYAKPEKCDFKFGNFFRILIIHNFDWR